MKYCCQCGAQMQDGDKFCMNCGSEYVENGGTTGNLPQQPASQTATDSSEPVIFAQAAHLPVPPIRIKRGSGLNTKLIIGALLAVLLAAGGFWGWSTYGTEAQMEKKLELAVKYLSDNNYEQAILAFNDVIRIDSTEVKGYQGLAKTYTLQGKYDEAQSAYEKGIAAVTTPPNKQVLQLGLAGMYIDQNQLADAEQAYGEIMNSSPNCLEAYWGLAMVYQEEGDNTKAETILRQAVTANPDEYRGYNTLALFLCQNSKQDEALNNIVQSLSLEINQQEAYLVLDSMYQNNWATMRSRTSGLSNQAIATMLEFYSYCAAADYPNAINTYQSKLTTQTGTHKATILAAICMVKNGDKTSAEVLIKQLNVSKLNDWLLSDLGRYYLAAGDQAKTKKYAIKALQADPTNLDAIVLLQAIDANAPDAKFYTAKALLYNWKPISQANKDMQAINSSVSGANVNTRGNTTGNIQNLGLVCQQGDWVYYSNISDGYKIYKMRIDNSDRIKLNEDKSTYVNAAGDWVYYRNRSDGDKIYRMRTDGSERIKLTEDRAADISIVGDWIYYQNLSDGDKIYRMVIDGSKRIKLNEDGSDNINVVDNWIYYSNKGDNYKIYKMRCDGTERVKLNDIESNYINVAGAWIYFSSDILYKIHIDGSGQTQLSDEPVQNINVVGNWIYCTDCSYYLAGNLFKIDTSGSGRTELKKGLLGDINVIGEWIYYCRVYDDLKLYKIRIDGSENQEVI